MGLTRDEVRHIATLCRIGLTEEELDRYSEQLSHILEQFQVLQELETAGVEPTGHAVALQNVMREDEVRPSLPRHLVLMNGPRVEEECFRVPVVLEES
jgi:aspartyl-tRNA(Asn)/glutamyl-tRNA(Gln) amidotransferase subunit C